MEVSINTEYIKLDQLLKYANLVETGLHAKIIIISGKVLVDGMIETRRGRKIYRGMKVEIEGQIIKVV